MRTFYLESKLEEDIDLKNQNRVENLPDPFSIRDAASHNCLDNKFDDLNRMKNAAHVGFKDQNLDNVRFVNVNSLPAVRQHLSVNEAFFHYLDESSLLRLDLD